MRREAEAAAFIRDRTLLLLGLVAVLFVTLWRLPALRSSVVVYCAHDAVFAEEILRDFEMRSGVKVLVRYDTEATKSLGLVELLLAEKDAPRCDVFWNNEMLGTADLAERGVLAPHRGPGWERIPEQWKDADARWTGFAARLRVHIINTRNPATDLDDLSRGAIAKPLYGTTLTHYTALWHLWGPERLKTWHHESRARGLREVNGNGMVKDIVARGARDHGFTDTDDFFDAKDRGALVAMKPVRIDGASICIPNTVALIRGAPHEATARQLIDYLLSAEAEMALAKSKSRQIPLGPVDENQLPAEVRELREWSAKCVPLAGFVKDRVECLAWLKSEYTE
ncbi:MAG: substrate-binding domain-containing protein [Chthoniobacteraceae bacterium]